MILSFTTITTKFYYFFISRKFDREMISVSQGRNTFLQNKFNKNVLVRNIHRIEKGISMKNRRNIFAMDYIDETIDSFIECSEKFKNDEQIDWAFQVLEKYFDLVDLKVLEKQYSKFKSIQYETNKKTVMVPYMRKDSVVSSISYDQFLKLNMRRRSVRWYKDQFISEELISKALKVTKFSPSSCNRQPFKFLFFNKKTDVQEISNIPMGTSGYSSNIPCHDPIEILECILDRLKGKSTENLRPHYKNFTGDILEDNENYVSKGKMTVVGTYDIRITELPIGTWTQN